MRLQGPAGVASGAGRLRIQNIDLTERRCGRSKTFRPPDLIMCLEGIPGVSHSNMSVLGKTHPHTLKEVSRRFRGGFAEGAAEGPAEGAA